MADRKKERPKAAFWASEQLEVLLWEMQGLGFRV